MQFGMLFGVLLEVLVTARPSAVSGGAVGGAGAQSSGMFFAIWGLCSCNLCLRGCALGGVPRCVGVGKCGSLSVFEGPRCVNSCARMGRWGGWVSG